MSFILDALRKSETERQQQAAPSLADAQYHVNKKQRSIWVPALIAILAANLIVIAYVLTSDSRVTDVAGESAGKLVERSSNGPPAEERVVATEIPAQQPAVAESAEPVIPEAATKKPAANGTTVRVAPEPVPEPEPVNLPSMQQLIQSGQLSLSPLHIDIHVYAGQADKRFIFVNMSKYREGDRLEEGPTVESITSTGVIFNHQGNRFTLDRE
jgi:general secretion pathway protein B